MNGNKSRIKKVSFVHPPIYSLITWEPVVSPPLGITSLAAFIRQSGYEVSCLDAVVESPYQITRESENVCRYGLDYRQIVDWIEKERPDVVGLSCVFSSQWRSVKEIASLIKRIDRDIIVMAGGTHPSFLPERCMRESELDFIVLGEGEQTSLELLDRLNQGGPVSDLDGLAYRDNGEIRTNPKTRIIENLDDLPFPARDLLPMEKYFKTCLPVCYEFYDPRNTTIMTSRGCPFRCTFCSSARHWNKRYRMHSPDYVFSEIDHLIKDFGIKELKFLDDNLTLDRERARKIFEGMIERDYRLYWNTPNGIALWTVDEDMLKLMKKSGCYYIFLPIDSGNQYVLDNIIKKPLKLERVREANDIMRRLGIIRGAYSIIGLPGETRAQIQDTLDLLHSLKIDVQVTFIYNPLPGSDLYDKCIEEGYITEDDFFKDPVNFYFASTIDGEDWTADELERLIRREWFRNYLAVTRAPLLVGAKFFRLIRHRPSIILFWVKKAVYTLQIHYKALFKSNKMMSKFNARTDPGFEGSAEK